MSAPFSLLFALHLLLAKFCENSASRFRMEECDVQTISTLTGSFVNKADALLIAHSESLAHTIFNLEGNMMNTTTTIVEELLNGAFGACWLQQLQFHYTHLQEGCLHFLVFYDFGLVNFQA